MQVRVLAIAVTMAFSSATAHAGRSCEARLPTADGARQSIALAELTMRSLEDSGAQVALLARAGQDLSRYRLRWSHAGWAYKTEDGWRVVHKLNECGSAHGHLYRQGLAEFFLDDPFEYRAAFAVPSADVQQKLLPVLRDNARASIVHTSAYSLVAYPWSQRYQQSNQWALEALAMSQLNPVGLIDRERAQAWLKAQGYRPHELRLGALTRLGARMTTANVAFDDHPNEKRFADRIETSTVDSMFEWLAANGLSQPMREVRP